MKQFVFLITFLTFIACKHRPAVKRNPSIQDTTAAPIITASGLPKPDSTNENAYYDLHRYLVNTAPDSATQIIKQKSAIFISPDSLQIEQLKKKYGEEDFYTIADDNSYYQAEADILLQKKPVTIITPTKRYVKLVGQRATYLIDTKATAANGWVTLFFRPDSLPQIADVTDAEVSYRNYFEHPSPKNKP